MEIGPVLWGKGSLAAGSVNNGLNRHTAHPARNQGDFWELQTHCRPQPGRLIGHPDSLPPTSIENFVTKERREVCPSFEILNSNVQSKGSPASANPYPYSAP